MQAVILAAGLGARMGIADLDRVPKGLLEVPGGNLLFHSLNKLRNTLVSEVILVTGYKGEVIRAVFGQAFDGLPLWYINSPDYATTGSMRSLFHALPSITGPLLVLESDLLYEQQALTVVLDSPFADTILVSDCLNRGDDVYVGANADQEITYLGKQVSAPERESALGALVGISKYSLSFLKALKAQAAADFQAGCWTDHYEECVMKTASVRPVYATYHSPLLWTEVDTLADLAFARTDIYPKIVSQALHVAHA